MSLYVIDREGGEIAASYVALDEKSKVFLLQDGLYLTPELFNNRDVYVLSDEVEERGLNDMLPQNYKKVNYSDIIELIMQNPVISFC